MRISDILRFLEAEQVPFVFRGDESAEVERFSSLNRYQPGTFTWVKTQENIPDGFDCSGVALAFVSQGVTGVFPNVIETPQSKRAFFSAIEHFYGKEEERPAVGHFTYISPRVKLGKNVRIGHSCTLDGEITIGDDTVIWNGVTIVNRVTVGQRCEIQSGCVIGHDGFGYTEDAAHNKTMVRHFGGVEIGNDVLVGENTCIDRGTIDDTRIENGVKLDVLCHIAHNVRIENRAALAAPCQINGSAHIGAYAYLAGASVRNQCVIGDNAFVGLGAVVVKNVAANTTVAGNPAKVLIKKKG